MATFNTRIQLKYDTYSNWTTNNPVLLSGEVALVNIPADSSTGMNEPALMMKVGNGSTAFNDLPWSSALAADVIPSLKGSSPTLPATSITGLADYISGQIQDTDTQYQIIADGDMGFKLQSRPKSGGAWTDVSTIELTAPTYSLESGDTNGTVSFNGEDVAVTGLKSAAYTESSAYDAAGSAAAVQTALIGTAQDASSANTINAAKKFATESIDTAMGTLNLNAVTAGTGQVIGTVAQTDGAVTAQVKTLTASDIPEIPQSKVENLTIALSGKQDTVSFDQEYNSTTNKAATVATVTGAVNAAKAELIGTPDDASNLNTINAAKKYADEKILEQISAVYKPAGSVAFASLPTPAENLQGNVYNITDDFTADTNFVASEQGKDYSAGTNVVCIEESTDVWRWDVLAGSISLDAYSTTEEMDLAISTSASSTLQSAKDYTNSAINGLDVAITNVTTGNKVASIQQTDGKISVTTTAIVAGDIPELPTSKITGLDTTLSGINSDITALEGLVGDTAVSTQISTAIGNLDVADSAVANSFVTSVSQSNGLISVVRTQPTVANISGLQDALDTKANTDDLATVATTGKIDDLTQTATIIFNCGSATTVI